MNSGNRKIMVVDDDEDDRKFFCRTLSQVNPDVLCLKASDGKEALLFLENTENSTPDVIFLDINMPVMTGWEFLTKAQAIDKAKNIPIIMFSTSSSQRDVNIAYDLGAFSYCVKPNEPSELRSMLKFVSDNLAGFTFPLLKKSGQSCFQFPKNIY